MRSAATLTRSTSPSSGWRRFPAAADTDRFWANIVAGVDAVTEVPADRWDVDAYYDA